MQEGRSRAYKRVRYLETVVYAKEHYVAGLYDRAMEHARLAAELNSGRHAREAFKLREEIQWWNERIERNKAEIARLMAEGRTD